MSETQKVFFNPSSEIELTIAQCFFEVIEREKSVRDTAESVNRQKDSLLAIVSHELRNTLNPIIGWVKLIRSGKIEKFDLPQALEVIERNTRIQKRLIEDLLAASQINNGRLRMNFEEFEVDPVIENALLDIKPLAEAKQIRIVNRIGPNLGCIIADQQRIEQTLLNLFSNSIKFTPHGGIIEVEARRTAAGIEISIADNGRGISPDYLPFVFDQFSQENKKGDESAFGLGLGLSIVRQIIEQHGGSVTAQSAGSGNGATFIINLPKISCVQPKARKRFYDYGAIC